jgi:hypothetical protein
MVTIYRNYSENLRSNIDVFYEVGDEHKDAVEGRLSAAQNTVRKRNTIMRMNIETKPRNYWSFRTYFWGE